MNGQGSPTLSVAWHLTHNCNAREFGLTLSC